MTPPDQEEIKSLTLQRDMLFESVDTAAQQLAALQKERDDFAYVMEAHTELQKQLLTLQKERNMLREQIRVADVAFQGLHERHQALQKENEELKAMTKLGEHYWLNDAQQLTTLREDVKPLLKALNLCDDPDYSIALVDDFLAKHPEFK